MENVAVTVGSSGRNAVLRNTYGLLSLTLIWSAALAVAGTLVSIPAEASDGLIVMGFLTLLAVRWFRKSVIGVMMVFVFTGIEGFALGPVINYYLHLPQGQEIVGVAVGLTGVVFLSLSGYVLTTRKDFSYLGGFLYAGLIMLILVGLIGLFVDLSMVDLAMAYVSALIFSGFILFDTSRVLNGDEKNYVMATLELYLDILNLFLILLRIVSAFAGNRR